MKKKAIILILVLFFIFGCTAEKPLNKPTEKISCCNRTIAETENRCELVNKPVDLNYKSGSCNLEQNICNITLLSVQKGGTSSSGSMGGITPIGEQTKKETIGLEMNTIEVPICTGVATDTCVQSNCMAMVCGDFLYRPKPLPSMPTEEEIEAGAAIPMTVSEEEGFSLYKADCRFFLMDENLSKFLDRTNSLVNSFRFGIGSPRQMFEDYETYKYYFPASDKFCTVTYTGSIDRYINYLDICAIPGGPCTTKTPADKLIDPSVSITKRECLPYTGGDLKEMKEKYPFLYTTKSSQYTLEPSGYRTTSGVFDHVFYVRALSAQYADIINNKQVAPFECKNVECMSGNCNKQTYHRTFIVKKDGSKEPVECYSDFVNGRKVVACTSTTKKDIEWDQNKDMPIVDIQYTPLETFVLHMGINDRFYDLQDLNEKCGGDDSYANLQYGAFTFGAGKCELLGSKACSDYAEFCNFDASTYIAYASRYNRQMVPNISKNVMISSIPSLFDAAGSEDQRIFKSEEPFPPARTVYFFNKQMYDDYWREKGIIKKNLDVYYGPKKIIGYALGWPHTLDERKDNLFDVCEMKEGEDYTVIDVEHSSPGTLEYFGKLSELLIEDVKSDAILSLGEKQGVSSVEMILASTPWVIAYEKCADISANYCSKVKVSKPEYRILAKYGNMFGLEKNSDVNIIDASQFKITEKTDEKFKKFYVLASRYVVLIHSLGNCMMEEENDVPQLEEYGWCEPCTYITMAYGGAPSPPETLDEVQKYIQKKEQLINYLKNGIMPILDFRKNAEIVDLSKCSTDIHGNIISCDEASYPSLEISGLLLKDENAVEGIGPVITIVGSKRNEYTADGGVAVEQANIINRYCEKCLVAVPFYASADSYAMEMAAANDFVPTNYINPDVILEIDEVFNEDMKNGGGIFDVAVIEFPIADVMSDYAKDAVQWNSKTAKEKADLVIERMYNYAWQINYEAYKIGKKQPVPVVILFNLESDPNKGWPAFNSKDDIATQENKRRFYADFFSNIYLSRDKLRKAGVIGIVYSPFAAKGTTTPTYDAQTGIVNLVNSFGNKFCAFEEGSYDFIGISLLNKINKITTPKKKECDIFQGKEGFSLKVKYPKDEPASLDCNLACYNETKSCSIMCKDAIAGLPKIQLNCLFKEGVNVILSAFDEGSSEYKSMAECTLLFNKERSQPQCVFTCHAGKCNISCENLDVNMLLGNSYFSVYELYQNCLDLLSPSGYLYCTPCVGGEKCGASKMICEDGTKCVRPPGSESEFGYKCPTGVISENCQLCSEKAETASCLMRKYTEPKAIDRFAIGAGVNYDSYFKEIKYSSLSDTDMDIIARLPKTDKCCLLDNESVKYTYTLTEMNAISTTPVVFATGQLSPQASQLQDCGFIDPTIIDAQGGLKMCGVTITPDEPLECKKTGGWMTYYNK